MKRTVSVARTGRRISSGVLTGGPAASNGASSKSAAVNTPTTPGAASASDVSIELILACANPERTKIAYKAAGSRRSSVYGRAPLSSGGSSTRRSAAPCPVNDPFDPVIWLSFAWRAEDYRRGSPSVHGRASGRRPSGTAARTPPARIRSGGGARSRRGCPAGCWPPGGCGPGGPRVQAERPEGLAAHEPDRLGHVSRARVRGDAAVAEERALERAADDLGD